MCKGPFFPLAPSVRIKTHRRLSALRRGILFVADIYTFSDNTSSAHNTQLIQGAVLIHFVEGRSNKNSRGSRAGDGKEPLRFWHFSYSCTVMILHRQHMPKVVTIENENRKEQSLEWSGRCVKPLRYAASFPLVISIQRRLHFGFLINRPHPFNTCYLQTLIPLKDSFDVFNLAPFFVFLHVVSKWHKN